jgi:hypothetical protein
MKATLLLCENAEVLNGRHYVMGGGLTWIYANFATPVAVAAMFDLEPSELGQSIQVSTRLYSFDGTPATGTDAAGNTFEYFITDTVVSPPADAGTHDHELDFIWSGKWFGLNLAPGRYQVRMINDATGETIGVQSFLAWQSN